MGQNDDGIPEYLFYALGGLSCLNEPFARAAKNIRDRCHKQGKTSKAFRVAATAADIAYVIAGMPAFTILMLYFKYQDIRDFTIRKLDL